MEFLLYHRKTRPTGRTLARMLGIEDGVDLRQCPDILFRWGCAKFPEWDSKVGQVFNSASSINTAGDKLRTLDLLRDAEIKVPEFQTARPDRDSGTWLGRNRRGFGGKDIVVFAQGVNAYEGYDHSEFFTKFVPNEREYRLHVVGKEVVRVQRKYLERPERQKSQYVKNHSNGYVFKAPQRSLRPERLDVAVRAVETLGLTWGAVDAVIDPTNTMYVLEINTAPSCSPMTAQAYADAFRKLIDERR